MKEELQLLQWLRVVFGLLRIVPGPRAAGTRHPVAALSGLPPSQAPHLQAHPHPERADPASSWLSTKGSAPVGVGSKADPGRTVGEDGGVDHSQTLGLPGLPRKG